MRSVFRYTLGISALVQVAVAVPVASGQSADPHACSYVQASDWLRITGRKDFLGRGPQASKPGETAAGTTECGFLTISLTVTSNMTPAWFARDRTSLEKTPDKWKVESVSGLGDEAYWMWDPRPGSNRNVGLVIRAAGKRVTVGELSDSVASSKPMLMQIAKLALPKVK
jgi:hypothetical protein